MSHRVMIALQIDRNGGVAIDKLVELTNVLYSFAPGMVRVTIETMDETEGDELV